MTTIAVQAKLEKELYPPITDLLAGQGLNVWEEATIRAGDQGTRTADHVAWRWEGDRIDALAVEVKPGNADVGLAQAVAYSAGFDRVFVAAEESFSTTGYIGIVFERLALGYIRVDPSAAIVEREADQSPFIVNAVRSENLARIRLKHLFVPDVVGEAVRFGADRRGDNWAVTGTTSEWQLCGEVITGSPVTYLSLLAESKWVGDAASRLDPGVLGNWISPLGGTALLELRERRHNGFRPIYSDVLRTWSPQSSKKSLAELLDHAQSLSGKKVGPHFEIRIALWPHSVSLTQEDARRDLLDTCERLRAVQSNLNGKL
jgi:hypothetical protein